MKTSTGMPTQAELNRWDDFHRIGCVACYLLGYPETPYDIHHFIDGGRRIGHFATAPLCPAHHRGIGFVPHLHLASIAVNQREFRQVFGEDYDLWCLVDFLISIKRRQAGLPLRREALPEAQRVE